MKKTLVQILIAVAAIAAAFSWQATFAGVETDRMDHGMGIECLAHCFMADADEADLVAVVTSVAVAVLAAVVWPSVAGGFGVTFAFVSEYVVFEPWHRFLLSRRD